MPARNITNTNPKTKLEVVRHDDQKSDKPLKIWYGDYEQLPTVLEDDTIYLSRKEYDPGEIYTY